MIRQPIISVMGHVDHGKCVSGDTLIELADGRLIPAESVFEEFKDGQPIQQPDGVVHQARNLKLLSVGQDGTVTAKNVSHVWKLTSDHLVHVETKAGYDIKTTQEHKFMVFMKEGEMKYVNAEQLTVGDSLLIPNRITVSPWNIPQLKRTLLDRLSDTFLLKPSKELNGAIEAYCRGEGVYKLGRQLGDVVLEFHIRKGYYRPKVFREIVSRLYYPKDYVYDQIDAIKYSSPKKRASHKSFWLRIPHDQAEFEALYYVIGLLYGDGMCGTANLSNTSNTIIEEFKKCIMLSFGIDATVRWDRTAFVVDHRGGLTFSKFLVTLFGYPQTDKTRVLKAPDLVCAAPDNLVSKFLQGFFDAEGYVQKQNSMGIACESKLLMRQLPMMLHRFGCLAYFAKKARPELLISGSTNLNAFFENVGFREPSKSEQLRANIERAVSNRVFDITPISGQFVSELRDKYGMHGKKYTFDINYYESKQSLTNHALSLILSQPSRANTVALQSVLSTYRMVTVTKLEVLEGTFPVYDFTVEDTHNFMANGLVVHNTTLLDRVRNTAIAAREAGGITQHIGASEVPIDVIKKICGALLKDIKITIPGLLFIDTPGHEAFTNLRRRGGSVADLAILVVDVSKGFEPQTVEAIEILKEYKTPFIVAANKIDLITGWRDAKTKSVLESLKKQGDGVVAELDNRIYGMIGKLSEFGLNAERFDRVTDFQKVLAIVPLSAKTGEGIAELLMMATGLAQRYLELKLNIETKGPGRGSILEKTEVRGLGTTIDVILYDGSLKVNDTIAFATADSVATAKVKALLKPKPLHQIGESASKYSYVDMASAASGIKVSGNGLEGAMPGSPVVQVTGRDYAKDIRAEIGEVFKTDSEGLVLKADSIGSIEAISRLLAADKFGISKKSIGNVTKRDVTDAFAMNATSPLSAVVLAFNVKAEEDAQEASQASGVRIIEGNIIYKLIDDYKEFVEQKKRSSAEKVESKITLPGSLEVLPNSTFRISHPAIFGVNILAGKIRPGYQLITSTGEVVGKIRGIQNEKTPVEEARKGDRLAISMDEPTFGRQVKENQVLYTNVGDEDYYLLTKEYAYLIGDEERGLLKKIIEIRQNARYRRVQ